MGQEGSDPVKACGSNNKKIEDAQLKVSLHTLKAHQH